MVMGMKINFGTLEPVSPGPQAAGDVVGIADQPFRGIDRTRPLVSAATVNPNNTDLAKASRTDLASAAFWESARTDSWVERPRSADQPVQI